MGGANDVFVEQCDPQTSIPVMRTHIMTVVNQLKTAFGDSLKIVFTGYGTPIEPQECDISVLPVVQAELEQIATGGGATFFDVQNLFKNSPSDQFSSPRYYADAVHLNVRGYNLMWSRPELQAAFGCSG